MKMQLTSLVTQPGAVLTKLVLSYCKHQITKINKYVKHYTKEVAVLS